MIRFIVFITFFLPSLGNTQELLVEIDPLTYVENGYSLHLRYHQKSLIYGVGIYQLDIPSFVTETLTNNKGWDDRIDQGKVLFLDYTFDEKLDGWLIGLEITEQKHKVTYESSSTQFDSIVYMFRFGYHYRPFKNSHFYLFPWAGIGHVEKTSGSTEIESINKNYELNKTTGFMTLHIGYSF